QQRVFLNFRWRVGLSITAHIGRDRPEARVRQRPKLISPRIPGLRKSVTEQHERALALLRDMHADPVRFDRTMGDLAHVSPLERNQIYYMRLRLCITAILGAPVERYCFDDCKAPRIQVRG